MKKALVIIAAIGFSIYSSHAAIDIAIAMGSAYGVDSSAVIGSNADLPAGMLYQLIWSPDNSFAAFNHSDPTGVFGNDILLGDFFTPYEGYIIEVQSFQSTDYALPSDGLVSGYVYARVFSAVAPTVGDYYGLSSVITGLSDQSPGPATPNLLELAPSSLFLVNNLIVNPICWQCLPGRGGWRATIH